MAVLPGLRLRSQVDLRLRAIANSRRMALDHVAIEPADAVARLQSQGAQPPDLDAFAAQVRAAQVRARQDRARQDRAAQVRADRMGLDGPARAEGVRGAGGGGYAKVMSEGFQAAQRRMYAEQAKDADIIITTALIPGKPAPKLITAEMVQSMKPGSVIVDLAAEQGGNCELTVPGEAVVRHGVTIIGYTDLVSRLARQSSTLYSNNLLRLTEELCKAKDGNIVVNFEDDAIRGLTVVKEGELTWPAPPPKLPAASTKSKASHAPITPPQEAAPMPASVSPRRPRQATPRRASPAPSGIGQPALDSAS